MPENSGWNTLNQWQPECHSEQQTARETLWAENERGACPRRSARKATKERQRERTDIRQNFVESGSRRDSDVDERLVSQKRLFGKARTYIEWPFQWVFRGLQLPPDEVLRRKVVEVSIPSWIFRELQQGVEILC